jgi:hypothetical protein
MVVKSWGKGEDQQKSREDFLRQCIYHISYCNDEHSIKQSCQSTKCTT